MDLLGKMAYRVLHKLLTTVKVALNYKEVQEQHIIRVRRLVLLVLEGMDVQLTAILILLAAAVAAGMVAAAAQLKVDLAVAVPLI